MIVFITFHEGGEWTKINVAQKDKEELVRSLHLNRYIVNRTEQSFTMIYDSDENKWLDVRSVLIPEGESGIIWDAHRNGYRPMSENMKLPDALKI